MGRRTTVKTDAIHHKFKRQHSYKRCASPVSIIISEKRQKQEILKEICTESSKDVQCRISQEIDDEVIMNDEADVANNEINDKLDIINMDDSLGATFSPKRTKSKMYCSVFGCGKKSCSAPTVRFHYFPRGNQHFVKVQNAFGDYEKIDCRTLWKQALKIKKEVTPFMQVCSMHFKRSDYILPDRLKKRRFLKKTAVPSCNLPKTTPKEQCQQNEALQIKERKFQSEERETLISEMSIDEVKAENSLDFEENSDVFADLTLPEITIKEEFNTNETCAREERLQEEEREALIPEVSIDKIKVEYFSESNKNSVFADPLLSKTTAGNQCYKNKAPEREEREILMTEKSSVNIKIEDVSNFKRNADVSTNSALSVDKLAEKSVDIGVQIKINNLIKDSCGLITSDLDLQSLTGIYSLELLNNIVEIVKLAYPKYRLTCMKVRSKIIMVFMTLKHNLSYTLLASIFKYSKVAQCQTTVNRMIDILADCLKERIYFPRKDEILNKNLPAYFNNFDEVRVILDSTEIVIQKPKTLCCQVPTYSQQKGSNSIKFMIGLTPTGLISFISEVYGGRVSNDTIIEQSNVLDLLEKGESIMVTERFQVHKLCNNKEINIIRPPSLQDKLQLLPEEALLNAPITGVRVHIGHVIQRLRDFKILNSEMPVELIKKGHTILTIIAAIVNMSRTVIKDEKVNK